MEIGVENRENTFLAVKWLVDINFISIKEKEEVIAEVERIKAKLPDVSVVDVVLKRDASMVQKDDRPVNVFDLAFHQLPEFLDHPTYDPRDSLSSYANKILNSYKAKIEKNTLMQPYFNDRLKLMEEFKSMLYQKPKPGLERLG